MNKLKSKIHLWKENITVAMVILMAAIITLILVYNKIEGIPRSVLPEFSDMLTTLLGLTFTAFSILVSITPRIRKDFVKTDVFDAIGMVFYITLLFQFIALIFSFISYILYSHTIGYILCIMVSIAFTVLSLGFLLYLIRNLFLIFKSIKNESAK